MSVDYPRGWQITWATAPEYHHPKCSYRTDSMLCDCDVLFKHPEFLSETFHGADGVDIATTPSAKHHPPVTQESH